MTTASEMRQIAALERTVPLTAHQASKCRTALEHISEAYASDEYSASSESTRWDEFTHDLDAFMLNFDRELTGLLTLCKDFSINYYAFFRSDSASLVDKHAELSKFIQSLESDRRAELDATEHEAQRKKLEVYLRSLRELTIERKEEKTSFVQGSILISPSRLFYKVVQIFAGPFFAVGLPVNDLLIWLINEQNNLRLQQKAREALHSRELNLEHVERLLSTLKTCSPESFLDAFTISVKELEASKSEPECFKQGALEAVKRDVNTLAELLVSLQNSLSL